jgi:hypothetical protein
MTDKDLVYIGGGQLGYGGGRLARTDIAECTHEWLRDRAQLTNKPDKCVLCGMPREQAGGVFHVSDSIGGRRCSGRRGDLSGMWRGNPS